MKSLEDNMYFFSKIAPPPISRRSVRRSRRPLELKRESILPSLLMIISFFSCFRLIRYFSTHQHVLSAAKPAEESHYQWSNPRREIIEIQKASWFLWSSIGMQILQDQVWKVWRFAKARVHSHRRKAFWVSILQEDFHNIFRFAKARAHSHRRKALRVSILQEDICRVWTFESARTHSHRR